MRRIASLLLLLLVICGQQALFVHGVAHLGPGTAPSASPASVTNDGLAGATAANRGDSGAHGYACDKCFQLAQVAAAAAAHVRSFVPARTALRSLRAAAPAACRAPALLLRNRGPPAVL